MIMMMMKKAPSYVMFAFFFVLSAHPCVCVLYGNEIHANFRSDCLDESLAGVFYECGEPPGRCICQDHTAYCSRSSPALPVLPDDIYVLDLCNYYYQHDSGQDVSLPPQFFSQLNHVTELRINLNDGMGLYGAFDFVANLIKVYIHCNFRIGKEFFKSVYMHLFSMPTLTSFISSRCDWIPTSLHLGPLSRLQSFSVEFCAFMPDNLDLFLVLFSSFKDLKRISVTDCHVNAVHPVVLPALEELILDQNVLTSFPQTCDMHNNSLFPSLNRLSIRVNNFSQIGAYGSAICLPQLTELILDFNWLSSSPPTCDMHNNSLFPSLKWLNLAYNSMSQIGANGSAICLPQLTELILDDNKLTSFPQTCDMHNNSLFPSLKTLRLASNSIRQIGANGSAICLPQLTELILDYNDLTSFPQTCDMHNNSLFPFLKTLSLTSNKHISQIGVHWSAICLPQLTELILYANDLTSFPQTCDMHNNSLFPSLNRFNLAFNSISQIGIHWSAICLPQLTELIINGNSLTSFPQTCDMYNNSFFPSLKKINLVFNRFVQIGDNGSAICLPQLTELMLFDNCLTSFPQTCDMHNSSFFPSMKTLSLIYNNMSQIGGNGFFTCLPQVTDIDLSWNPITSIQRGVFDAQSCPRLETINLSGGLPEYIFTTDYLFANPSIKSLNLTNSGWRFADCTLNNCVAPNTFANSSITNLTLDGNDFSGVSSARFFELFGSLSNLVHLSLSRCNIDVKYLSIDMFGPNIQNLDLSNNNISTLASQPLPPTLTTLFLHNNSLSTVPQGLIDLYRPIRLTTFTLYDNPLTCSCDNRWLQTLLRSHPNLFRHPDLLDHPHPDLCVDDQNKKSSLFTILGQPCLLGKEASIAIIVICCVFICPMTLVPLLTILSRYRWHVRLLLHYAFNGQKDDRQEPNYVYDVFVSYDQEDHRWVRQHLMPELEERLALRLCIHERDFIPGHYIVTNITQAVEHSKRVLIVFSKNFVLSQWCQFEMDYCLSHVIQKGDSLLMVCLDHVSSTDPDLLTGSMKAALTTMTYIQWKDRPDALNSFWGRIRLALRDVIPRQQPQRRHDPLDPDVRVNMEMQLMDF